MDNICFENNLTILRQPDSFRLSEILECGQCFRFEKISDEDYIVVAFNRLLHIFEKDRDIYLENTSKEDFNNIWISYFDLNLDYGKIKEELSKKDSIMREAINYAPGIRIIKQDFFECLISFIISQNNRIPMIKKVIENISQKYGEYIGTYNEKDYYSFPGCKILKELSVEELMECKTGFRAGYIIDASKRFYEGSFNEEELINIPYNDARKELMQIKGVGPKVADCVLLFSLAHTKAFPVDVWVKRVMEYFYFNGLDTKKEAIEAFATDKFGDYKGFAQQYLFNYARQMKIGTK